MIAEIVVGVLVAVAVMIPAVGRGRSARVVAGAHAAGAPRGHRRAGLLTHRDWQFPWSRRTPAGDLVLVVVAQVAALLSSGASPAQAWHRGAGVPADGQGIPDVAVLARHVGGPATAAAVAAACRLAADVGAPLVGVLDEVAASVAEESRAQAEREAAFAGPRTTVRVLAWLPVVGIVMGAALGADPFATAFDGGLGSAAAALGLVFFAAGRRWSARLVAQARRAGEEE